MKRLTQGAIVASLALVVPTTLAAPAFAADITVRGTDSETTGQNGRGGIDVLLDRSTAGGSWEFLEDGIAMSAPTTADRSGVYWASPTDTIPTSVAFEWDGTRKGGDDGEAFADPAIVIFFDPDGDGDTYGRSALLHEDIYGENDAWLSSSSEAVQASAPETNAGSGSPFSGDLSAWSENLAEDFPDLEILAVGVNLSDEGEDEGGSNGTISSVTLGEDTYTFTNTEEQPPAAPIAADDTYFVNEGEVLEVTAPGVLGNDSGGDGSTLTAALARDAANGQVELDPDGGFTYTPEEGFSGVDVFTYRATDGTTTSEPATVEITVDPVEDPAPVEEDVRGGSTVERDNRRVEITFTSQAPSAEDAVVGEKLRWRVSVNGQVEARIVQGFDEVDSYARRFPANSGTYRVRVAKNGEVIRDFTINTGNPRR